MLVLQSGWNIRRFPISRWCLLDAYCGRCFTFSEINSSGHMDAKWILVCGWITSAQEDLLSLLLPSPLCKTSIHHHFARNPSLGEFCLNYVFTSAFDPIPPFSSFSFHPTPQLPLISIPPIASRFKVKFAITTQHGNFHPQLNWFDLLWAWDEAACLCLAVLWHWT